MPFLAFWGKMFLVLMYFISGDELFTREIHVSTRSRGFINPPIDLLGYFSQGYILSFTFIVRAVWSSEKLDSLKSKKQRILIVSNRDGGARGLELHFFPNTMLEQLRFRTFVVQFPGEACKMFYFSRLPHLKFRSAASVQLLLVT